MAENTRSHSWPCEHCRQTGGRWRACERCGNEKGLRHCTKCQRYSNPGDRSGVTCPLCSGYQTTYYYD